MTDKERSSLTEAIIKKLAKLEIDIVDLKEETKPVSPDCAIGRVSRMDAINNNSVNLSTLRKKEQQFQALQSALENINEEDFGVCVSCKKTIQPGRLLLVPESRRCIECARRN